MLRVFPELCIGILTQGFSRAGGGMPTPREVYRVDVLILVDDYSGFTRLLSEHGFSALVSVEYGDGSSYRVLMDFGTSGRVLLYNARTAGADLNPVDSLVLSHRHYDHSEGLVRLSKLLAGKPLLAHPDVLKPCYSTRGGSMRFNVGFSPKLRETLRDFEVVLLKESVELSKDLWFLGEVERYYDNSYAVEGFKTVRDGSLTDEHMLDDTGIAVRVGSRALVVVGCSHSGISNIVRKARKVTGASEVVVIGGLHLAQAEPQDIERVVNELEVEGVTEVHAAHCTGLKGEAALLRRYGDRLKKVYSGYRLRVVAD
jgi:7,8-dihydropterin-6-yl-methyl-4-(beta-D-ribofuranosyl)aminobenzene 5'-phosphate synthase